MIPRILFAFLLLDLTTAFTLTLPEITSYAKVSKNGQETKNTGSGPFSWITRALTRANVSSNVENESRSVKDIVITVSPIYVPPKTPKLKTGEVVDYPSTKREYCVNTVLRYSTIDEDLLAKLDSTKSKIKIQERFRPPAIFEHSAKQQVPSSPSMSSSADSSPDKPPSSSISGYSRPVYAGPYNLKTTDYDKPKDYIIDNPISKPIGMDNYPSIIEDDKPMDSYKNQMDPFPNHQNDQMDFPSFSSGTSYDDHAAPKPIEFDRPTFDDDDNDDDDNYPPDHDHYHEVIYDHLPEFHHHHHHRSTTPEPEMNDQRLDKRPYSYYFIGKKLWYIPLYFTALVLKSIARHKITFPAHLAEATGHGRTNNNDVGWWDLTNRVFTGIERFAERFGKGS
ncbi:histone-lysine N-methyltransferase set1 [Vespula maculifrons]|uniref:Histone-lysine N-methyltransferase set1 n=1 Tax=Vespula maculifrons TaxID=7453 RepID=A0ABD2D104_VESMC